MKRPGRITSIFILALSAALLLFAGRAAAAQPVLGGTLLVAARGPVTATLLGSEVPIATHTYALNVWWSIGPDPLLDTVSGGRSFAFQNRFTGEVSPPGTRFMSPALDAGTPFVLGAFMLSGVGTDPNFQSELLHTGLARPMFITQPESLPNPFPFAAVFAGAQNTALVGFPIFSTGPFPGAIGGYPLRVSLTNVCQLP